MTRSIFLAAFLFPVVAQGGRERVDERRVFDAVNRERTRRGLRSLVWSAALGEAARKHSVRMAQAGFFSHEDPRRGDLVRRLALDGIRYERCAENIYRQSGGRDPVAAACSAWMKSAGHRANILNRAYGQSGIGAAVTRSGECFLTQIFLGKG